MTTNKHQAQLPLQAIRGQDAEQIPYRESLAARLEELLGAYQEDYEGRSLSPSAISILVGFLRAHTFLREPSLTATPSGDLYAEWIGPCDRLLGVRFLSSGDGCRLVVFAPNPLHGGRTDRTSGTTTADALMSKPSYSTLEDGSQNEG